MLNMYTMERRNNIMHTEYVSAKFVFFFLLFLYIVNIVSTTNLMFNIIIWMMIFAIIASEI